MKLLVMFRNVTCVVHCCMTVNDDDTDGGGPVQSQVGRMRMMTRRVFDVFSWRFLRNEKKTAGEECDTSAAACGIEHAETALPYLH